MRALLAALVLVTVTPCLADDAQLAPTDLAASAQSWRRVQLTWTHGDVPPIEIKLERRVAGGTYAQIATLFLTQTDYLDETTSGGTSYEYRIMCKHGVLWTSSNVASVTTPAYVAPNPTASVLNWRRVQLTWSAITLADAGNLLVQRMDSSSGWVTVATLSPTLTTYTDLSCSPSTSYEYRLRLRYGTTESTPSSNVPATTPAFVAAQGLSASALSSSSIRLTWTSVDSEATELRLERRPTGVGSFALVSYMSSASVLTYDDTGLAASTSYEYRLVAIASTGLTSTPSSTASATTSP